MQPPDGDALQYAGRFQRVERPRCLEMTWPAYGRAELQTLLRVELVETSAHETEVVIVHNGLPDEEARANHLAGWSALLDQLESAQRDGRI